MNQLSCLWEGNHTLSGFWEVHGVRAHCLLDRRCKGVMASSNFAQAMGMNMFWLDQPVSLQLACVGSKSMINYSACAVIKFGNTTVKETFDITNIDYYDVTLGNPFLRQLRVVLDFNGPGHIHMGTTLVPRNHPSESCNGEPTATTAALSVRIFPYPTGQSKMTKCLLERPSRSWPRYIYICVRW